MHYLYRIALICCLLLTNFMPHLLGQEWLKPHHQLQLKSKPNPTSLENLIGANAGKEIGQNTNDFKGKGVIKNLRSFHIMGSDYGNSFFPNEQIILPHTCNCDKVYDQENCAPQICYDNQTQKSKPYGFLNWKAHYCDWKNGYKMETIHASLEAIFPKLTEGNPCTKTGFGRGYPNKWYTQEEWGGSFSNIRSIAATYAENFAITFCPDDPNKQCLVDVLEVGNEPWGKGDDGINGTPDDTPGKEGYRAICWGVIDGLTRYYKSSNPDNWRMKLSTAAFEAYTKTPGCGDDPNQYIEVMIPDDYQNGKSLRSYFNHVSIHNYAFPKASLCQDQHVKRIPESNDGLFLTLKNMKKWIEIKMPHAKLNITEFGWNSKTNTGCYSVGQANQAIYLVRAFLLAARYDVHKAFAYAFYDHPEETLYCSVGFQDKDSHAEKKSLKAIRKLNQTFGGKHFIKVMEEQADEGIFAYLIGDYNKDNGQGKPTHLVAWRAYDLMKENNTSYPKIDNIFTAIPLKEWSVKQNGTYTYLGWDNTKDGSVGNHIVQASGNMAKIKLSGMPIVIPLNEVDYVYDKKGEIIPTSDGFSDHNQASMTQVSCGNLTIAYGNGTIEIKGKVDVNYKKMEIIDITGGKYQVKQLCVNDCGHTQTITGLPKGNYLVKVFDANWQQVCLTPYGTPLQLEEGTVLENNTNDSTIPGCEDSDNDGVCDDEDCAPYDANLPKTVGTVCDDGHTNTINDKIQADGCTCKGDINNENTTLKTVSCGEINIQYGNGQIIMSGVAGRAYRFSIQDINRGWKEVYSCWSSCGSAKKVTDLPPSRYNVKVYGGVNACSKYINLLSSARSRSISTDIFELATTVNQQTIQLEWVAGQVSQTDKFIIEKSMDGVFFESLQEINYLQDFHYKELDNAPDYGTNYYRIKQLFIDGGFRYSTISAEKYFLDKASITLFPNPAKDVLNLNIGHFTPLEGTIHIFNRIGLEMDTKVLDSNNQQLQVNTSAYPNGIYFLIIEAKNRKPITRQFIIDNGQ